MSKQPDYQLRKRLGMSLPNMAEVCSLMVPARHLSFQKSDKGSTLKPGLRCVIPECNCFKVVLSRASIYTPKKGARKHSLIL